MKDYSHYKDQYYDKLLSDFTTARGISFLQEPQDILGFERYIEMEFTKLPKESEYNTVVWETTKPTAPVSISPPQTPVTETEAAMLITNGYQKVLWCVLHNKFFPVSTVELDDELLFDLIERGVITSGQAKDMKKIDLF